MTIDRRQTGTRTRNWKSVTASLIGLGLLGTFTFVVVASLSHNWAFGLNVTILTLLTVSVSLLGRKQVFSVFSFVIGLPLLCALLLLVVYLWLAPFYRRQALVDAILNSGGGIRLEKPRADRPIVFLRNAIPRSLAAYIAPDSDMEIRGIKSEISAFNVIDYHSIPVERLRFVQLRLDYPKTSKERISGDLEAWLNSLPERCWLEVHVKACSTEEFRSLARLKSISSLYFSDLEAAQITETPDFGRVERLALVGEELTKEQAEAFSKIDEVESIVLNVTKCEPSAFETIFSIKHEEFFNEVGR